MGIKINKDINIHLKIDDIVISLLNDYHNITPIEVIAFFSDMAKQSSQVEGNIVNKNKRIVKTNKRTTFKETWKTVKIMPSSLPSCYSGDWYFDAYSLRGFYPGTKIPFKLSGVKHNDSFAFFVVSLGNKNKITKINMNQINDINEAIVEATLLDLNMKDISDQLYKTKKFKLQRPKGLPLLKKAKDIKQ